jgi:hypothetical protein
VSCGFDTYDFSTLTTTDLNATDEAGKFAYFLRPCGSISSAAAANCLQVDSGSSACQVQVGGIGAKSTYDLGNWDAAAVHPTWSLIDKANPGTGVQYTMQGAKQWSHAGKEQKRTQFQCSVGS